MKQGIQTVLFDNRYYRIIYVRCENNETTK